MSTRGVRPWLGLAGVVALAVALTACQPAGTITTVLRDDQGPLAAVYPGWDGGPHAVAVDHEGNAYAAFYDQSVWRVPADGSTPTLVQPEVRPEAGAYPQDIGVAVAPDDTLYFPRCTMPDTSYVCTLQHRTADGTVVTAPTPAFAGGAPFTSFQSLAAETDGHLLAGDVDNCRIVDIDPATGVATLVFGEATCRARPYALTAGPDGAIYIAAADTVDRLDPTTQVLTVVAGGGHEYSNLGDGGPATDAQIAPAGVAVAPDGTIYTDDIVDSLLKKVTPDGTISTLASIGSGNGISGVAPEACVSPANGIPLPQAFICRPMGLALDASGNLWIAGDAPLGTVERIEAPFP